MGNAPSSFENNVGVEEITHHRSLIQIIAVGSGNKHGSNDSWEVNVKIGDESKTGISIENPFEPAEEENLRWHVEENARVSPYEKSKRRAVQDGLRRYAHALITKLFPSAFFNRQTICILDIQAKPKFSSFHKLHWELLEDLELWPPNFSKPSSVLVRRSFMDRSPALSLLRARQWKRILIITSRPKGHRDIPARLVSLPLYRLIDELKSQNVNVRAEIVRPGTWEAAKDHLARSGPNYFNIVHFDVHGCIQNSTAFLKFQSPLAGHPPTLVSAKEVGVALQAANIRYVVINACESAKFGMGTVGSFAESLLQNGVQEVTAMSYEISASSVEKFVETFYSCLLRHGLDFLESACLARRYLATDKAREARFGELLDVEDFFVPILISGSPIMQISDCETFQATWNHPRELLGSDSVVRRDPESELRGREYDVTEIERLVIESLNLQVPSVNVCVIHGMIGVGKTALARHLRWWWRASHLVEKGFFDFFDWDPFSSKKPLDDSMKWLQEALHCSSDDELVRKLFNNPYLVVLDAVNIVSQNTTTGRNKFTNAEKETFKRFFQSLQGGKSFLILTSRCEEDWLEVPALKYRLEGLNDKDFAVKLLDQRLKEMGSLKSHNIDPRTFESILQLLEYNPAAVQIFTSGYEDDFGPTAPQKLLNDLRRNLVSLPRLNPFSKRWLGLRSMETLQSGQVTCSRVQFGKPEGLLVLAMIAVCCSRVRKDWFEFWIRHIIDSQGSGQASDILLPLYTSTNPLFVVPRAMLVWTGTIDPEVAAQLREYRSFTVESMMKLIEEEFVNAGLLTHVCGHPEYFDISSFLTWNARYILQWEKPNIIMKELAKWTARQYFVLRCAAMNELSSTAINECSAEIEFEAPNFLAVFDELIELEADKSVPILPTIASVLSQPGMQVTAECPPDPTATALDLSNAEVALFLLFSTFARLALVSRNDTLAEEIRRRCERYLRRVNILVDKRSPQYIPPDLALPIIQAFAWLGTSSISTDPQKAAQYLDFILNHILGPLIPKTGTTESLLLLELNQMMLRLARALIAFVLGDLATATAFCESIAESSFESINPASLSQTSRSFYLVHALCRSRASLFLSAMSHSDPYTSNRTSQEIQKSHDIATTIKSLESEINSSRDSITNWARLWAGLWGMSAFAQYLGLDSSQRGRRRLSTTLSMDSGLQWVDRQFRILQQKFDSVSKEMRDGLLSLLQQATRSDDLDSQLWIHDHLAHYYMQTKDWSTACEHIQKIRDLQSRLSLETGFFTFVTLTTFNPLIRLRRDLRWGICYLMTKHLFSSAACFATGLASPAIVQSKMEHAKINVNRQLCLLKQSGDDKGVPIAEQVLIQLSGSLSKLQGAQRQAFANSIARHMTADSVDTEVKTKDRARILLLGLNAALIMGIVDENDFNAAIRSLVGAAKQL